MTGNQTHGFSDTTLLGGIKIQGTKATVLPIPLILITFTMPILRINDPIINIISIEVIVLAISAYPTISDGDLTISTK